MLERKYQVLLLLFEERQRSQLQALGVDELAARLHTSREAIWDDLTYLRGKGLIVINERPVRSRVFYTFDITTEGIDAAQGLTSIGHYQRPHGDQPSAASGAPPTFFSHSHSDNSFCQRLVTFIRQQLPTIDLFYDESHLGAGAEWMRAIPNQVLERPAFIVALSPQAVVSNWVREETEIALREAMGNPHRVVIPVLHQDCDIDQLSPLLKNRQITNCIGDRELSGFAVVVNALLRLA